mmetsp:Transcript_18268/g.55999  ORF Transcript_18268/g.55999 Transcript_18268/m.55999 type:complete len:232 (-) Transcript_18268:782-1477(-)
MWRHGRHSYASGAPLRDGRPDVARSYNGLHALRNAVPHVPDGPEQPEPRRSRVRGRLSRDSLAFRHDEQPEGRRPRLRLPTLVLRRRPDVVFRVNSGLPARHQQRRFDRPVGRRLARRVNLLQHEVRRRDQRLLLGRPRTVLDRGCRLNHRRRRVLDRAEGEGPFDELPHRRAPARPNRVAKWQTTASSDLSRRLNRPELPGIDRRERRPLLLVEQQLLQIARAHDCQKFK